VNRTEAFELSGYSDRSTVGAAEVVSFDRAARLKRALIGLAGFWGTAIVAAFLPVAHFFLVPGLILTGLIVFVLRWRRTEATLSIKGRPRLRRRRALVPSARRDMPRLLPNPEGATGPTPHDTGRRVMPRW
jgi:hypothetical protein